MITEFADKKGWKIVHWYVEPEQSAKYEDVDERPVFAQMFKDGEAGAFQVALRYANSRWSRNTALTFLFLSLLRRAWVWDIDGIQQDGHGIAFTVDTQMNEAYIRQLSKRTIDGKEDRARTKGGGGQIASAARDVYSQGRVCPGDVEGNDPATG